VNREPGSTRQRILDLLKLKGPQTSAELASQIGVTAVAVRQHIQALSGSGLLEPARLKRGVGRPARCWALTAQAESEFPDDHQRLALDLLEAMGRAPDAEALDSALEQLHQIRVKRYLEAIPPELGSFEKRLARLAELRDDEGHMAEYAAMGEGRWLLTQCHCPIREAAERCEQLCDLEPRLFSAVLGEEVSITRTEHIRAGGQSCTYEIREATSADDA